MAKLTNLNPDAADALAALAVTMRDRELAQQLAKTALQRTAMQHRVGVAVARASHRKLPRVVLS